MVKPFRNQVMAALVALAMACGPVAAATDGDVDNSTSAVRPLIERYTADRRTLSHVYDTPLSVAGEKRFADFYTDWIAKLQQMDFDQMDQESKVDYLLFDNHLRYQMRLLDEREKQEVEMSPLLPFAKIIVGLDEARRRMEPPKSQQAAAALTQMVAEIAKAREAAEAGLAPQGKGGEKTDAASATPAIGGKRTVASRTAITVGRLR